MTQTTAYTCPNCGHTIYPGFDKRVVGSVPPNSTQTILCPNCGIKMVPHDPREAIGRG